MRALIARLVQRNVPYEPEVQDYISGLVGRGWTCADVGAHEGIYTRLLADLVGHSGQVVAFEAHPENAGRLRSSLRNERRSRVTVENLAVTDGAAEKVTLHPGR